MKELSEQILREAVDLIGRLRSGSLSDGEISCTFTQLRKLLPDPHFMAYTIDHVPELPAEVVVRRAFAYRPFLMPAPQEEPKP